MGPSLHCCCAFCSCPPHPWGLKEQPARQGHCCWRGHSILITRLYVRRCGENRREIATARDFVVGTLGDAECVETQSYWPRRRHDQRNRRWCPNFDYSDVVSSSHAAHSRANLTRTYWWRSGPSPAIRFPRLLWPIRSSRKSWELVGCLSCGVVRIVHNGMDGSEPRGFGGSWNDFRSRRLPR